MKYQYMHLLFLMFHCYQQSVNMYIYYMFTQHNNSCFSQIHCMFLFLPYKKNLHFTLPYKKTYILMLFSNLENEEDINVLLLYYCCIRVIKGMYL